MTNCLRCGQHRPGINVDGFCPSCEKFLCMFPGERTAALQGAIARGEIPNLAGRAGIEVLQRMVGELRARLRTERVLLENERARAHSRESEMRKREKQAELQFAVTTELRAANTALERRVETLERANAALRQQLRASRGADSCSGFDAFYPGQYANVET